MVTVLPTMADRCMRLFSAKNYVKIRWNKKCTWVHHVDAVSALALSKDASMLYSISWDRTFKLWRTSDFKCLESVWRQNDVGEQRHSLVSTPKKHKSAVNALALSSDGSILYSGTCDRSILVWEKDGGAAHMAVAGALRGHRKVILCLTFVSDLLCILRVDDEHFN
ncbi:hypothetical protein ACS0TY_006546 [Phlomoides rotata]